MRAGSAHARPSGEGSRLVSARVYAALRARIAALDLPPGSAVSEKEIAEQANSSRTPVREAFLRLAEEGLLDIYPQFGTFVAPIRVPAVLHANFVRDSLECSIVRVVAHRRRTAFLDELQAGLARQWAAIRSGDASGFFNEDERMHRSFAEEAGHEPVWRVIDAAKVHVDRVRRLRLPEDLRIRSLVEEHERIAAALVAQDADAASAAMHDHLDDVVRGLARMSQLYPEYFDTARGRPSRATAAERNASAAL
jgi:GntR family transcriptional regulator, rspAB operon transcriptional repressor